MAGLRSSVVVATVAAILAMPASVCARDWHVAPDGVDGSAGTTDEPLATLAHAVSRASSGDSILLKRGGTYHAASGIDWRADEPVITYLGDDGLIFADGFESGDSGAWSLH